MPRTDSPLRNRMIFAFGARRSGTWWLQRILTAHPQVSEIPSETYLFELGVRPLLERFHHGVKSSQTVAELYADRDTVLDATRDLCDRVFAPYLDQDAAYLSERSPGHAKAVDVIAAVYPDARLVHIIRDGRDVARSLVARDWGPASVAEAAREWRDSILSARQHAPKGRYLEVSYEALLHDLEGGVRDLYDWLELGYDDAVVEGTLAVARRPANEDPTDPRIAQGKWRDYFSDDDLAAFEAEAGDLMQELGYERAAARAAGTRPGSARPASATVPKRGLVERVRGRITRPTAPAEAGGQPKLEIGGALAVSQRVADDLLSALHQGNRDAARALLADDATLHVVDDGGEEQLAGADAIADSLFADRAWAGIQQYGDAHAGSPTFTLVLRYTEGWRILCIEQRKQLVRALTLYRISA